MNDDRNRWTEADQRDHEGLNGPGAKLAAGVKWRRIHKRAERNAERSTAAVNARDGWRQWENELYASGPNDPDGLSRGARIAAALDEMSRREDALYDEHELDGYQWYGDPDGQGF